MNTMDFQSFIHMGGYALNVWGAYGLGFVIYASVMMHAVIRYERLKKRVGK